MFMNRRQKYERLDTPEVSSFGGNYPSSISSNESENSLHYGLRPLPSKLRPKCSWVYLACKVLLFGLSLLVAFIVGELSVVGLKLGPPTEEELDRMCFEHTSIHSPMVEDVPVRWTNVTFDAALFRRTIYREDPSPEVDQAWWDLGIGIRPTLLPPQQALRGGLHPGMAKSPPENGTQYFAQYEVFHQLHCLDLLRKSNHFNWDYYADLGKMEWENDVDVLKEHIGHCTDLLRQQLMCTADVGIFGAYWWDGEEVPVQEFSTEHRCRNFDDVLDYALSTQLPLYPWEYKNGPRKGDVIRGGEGDIM